MKRFKNILLYAGTENHDVALNRAFTLAHENGARLTMMDVVKPLNRTFGFLNDQIDPTEMERLIIRDRREKLLARANQFSDMAVHVDAFVGVGDTAIEITRQVIQGDHDLVIKTADGVATGSGRVFGSVAKSLMRICPCPVWVLKPELHGDFDTILAAIDVETSDREHQDLNHEILQLASSLAHRDDAVLHVVAAWEIWMEHALRRRAGDSDVDAALQAHKKAVQKEVDGLLDKVDLTDLRLQVHLSRGSAAEVIQAITDEVEADLLVMGTVCRTRVAGFLIGNTAESVVANIDCSLLALKPTGFASPVEKPESRPGYGSANVTVI